MPWQVIILLFLLELCNECAMSIQYGENSLHSRSKQYRIINTSPFASYDEWTGLYQSKQGSAMYDNTRSELAESDAEYWQYHLNTQAFPVPVPAPVSIPHIVHDNTSNIPLYEMRALEDLFYSTEGDQWKWRMDEPVSTHWNFTGLHNPCIEKWQGLTCFCVHNVTGVPANSSCLISSIILIDYAMRGTVPESIANFTYLEMLQLSYNYLVSTIPESVYQLHTLLTLDFSYNNMSGTLSSEVSSLPLLTHFILTNNMFNSTIPSSLSKCTRLVEIDIGYNQIWGTLPESLSTLYNVTIFNLYANSLTGSLPDSYGNMTSLKLINLFQNLLTNSIPASFGALSSLWELNLFQNHLNGSLPTSLANLHNLYTINVFSNYLTGPIPVEIFTPTSHLLVVNLFDNLMTGDIPEQVGLLPKLIRLDFCTNQLSSTLPASIGNLTRMIEFYLNNNLNLYSTIPESYTELKNVFVFYIQNNALSGTISPRFGRLLNMSDFDLSGNQLTGSLPEDFGNLYRLSELSLFGNQLTSSIPDSLTNCVDMTILYLSSNLFSGSLPKHIGRLSNMVDFYINNNLISGSVPSGLTNMTQLTIFLADSNILDGDINLFINSSTQASLTTLGMSDNQLTGSLPSDLFKIKTLATVALVTNCITGTIPEDTICSADSQLQMLALDGITAASNCQYRIFSHIPYIHAYGLSSHLKKGIPECLFQLPKLETLHLSGNALSGSLAGITSISDSLTDLSLSHNLLSGTIPDSIQLKEWTNLDLSYNRLTGILNEEFHPIAPSSALSLQDNRLSGAIPNSLQDAYNISVLLSNLFSCDYTRSQLPDHDSTSGIYQCGSDQFNRAILFYAVALAILLMIRLAVFLSFQQEKHSNQQQGINKTDLRRINKKAMFDRRRFLRWIAQFIRKLHLWMSIYYDGEHHDVSYGDKVEGSNTDDSKGKTNERQSMESTASTATVTKEHLHLKADSNILLFGHIAHALRSASLLILAVILLLFLPVYAVLSIYYKTYTDEYAFTVSAAFLSGELPTAILFILYGLFMVMLFNVFDKTLYYGRLRTDASGHIVRKYHSNSESGTKDSSLFGSSQSTRKSLKAAPAKIHYTLCAVIVLINTAIVFMVNIAFVYISINYDSTVIILAQISVAVFKLTWSDIALRGMIRVGSNFVNGRRLASPTAKTKVSGTVESTQAMRTSVFFDVFRLTSSQNNNSNSNRASKTASATFSPATISSLWNRPSSDLVAGVKLSDSELPRSTTLDSSFGGSSLTSPDMVNASHHSIIQHIHEQEYESRYIIFQIVLSLINNIAIPFLATTAISSACFYNIFVEPPQVEASYSITQCALYYLQINGNVLCVLEENLAHDVSFAPPFIYSYQCSNSFVTSYGAMYVYMYVVVLFVNPCLTMSIVELKKHTTEGSWLNQMLVSLLPPILKPLPDAFPTTIPLLFDRDGFIVRTARNIAILSTLGLIFPPLAVVICTSMVSYTFYEQIKISRFLILVYEKCRKVYDGSTTGIESVDEAWEYFEKYKKILETQCNNTLAPLNSLFWLIIPFAVLFYSYFLFDMLGNAIGFNAIYITLGVAVMPVAIYVSFTTYRKYKPIKLKKEGHQSNEGSGGDGNEHYSGFDAILERLYKWFEAMQREKQVRERKGDITPLNSMEMTPSVDRQSVVIC